MRQALMIGGSSKGRPKTPRSFGKVEGHLPSLRKRNRGNLFVSKSEDRQPRDDGLRKYHSGRVAFPQLCKGLSGM